MIDTIFIGMSGLTTYSNGLRGIANNVSNLNTPGFKSSTLQFADLFYSNDGNSAHQQGAAPRLGHGVVSGRSVLNLAQGELRQTGNTLDLAIEGEGMFVLRDSNGHLRYTRAGQFELDSNGVLVDRTTGARVMQLGDAGVLAEVNVDSQRLSAPQATQTVTFAGNLSSTKDEETITGVKVVDTAGTEHLLTLVFTSRRSQQAGRWDVTLKDGETTVGQAAIEFADGRPTVTTAKPTYTYRPAGAAEMPLALDFGGGAVTSFASGSLSSLAFANHDGHGPGALSSFSFDDRGVLQLRFANGQRSEGPRLALASLASPHLLVPSGGNTFVTADGAEVAYGTAGEGSFGALRGGSIEISNVDLSQQFSDMVIMQRGYQASAQIVSTANDMLQELFGIRR